MTSYPITRGTKGHLWSSVLPVSISHPWRAGVRDTSGSPSHRAFGHFAPLSRQFYYRVWARCHVHRKTPNGWSHNANVVGATVCGFGGSSIGSRKRQECCKIRRRLNTVNACDDSGKTFRKEYYFSLIGGERLAKSRGSVILSYCSTWEFQVET